MNTEMEVKIPTPSAILDGDLATPKNSCGLVLFAHGSGSSRHSPRNRFVARKLNEAGLSTLLFDLLTPEEELVDVQTAQLRFDIEWLAERLGSATEWAVREALGPDQRIGYFGSSTGGGAALMAAAKHAGIVGAVVSRGGRPDLAGAALAEVHAPTLLLVGSRDEVVIRLNAEAMAKMRCEVKLELVEGATHLFEEPGTLECVAGLAGDWFVQHLAGALASRGK